jgi:mono/diheme cytochrome c family protein
MKTARLIAALAVLAAGLAVWAIQPVRVDDADFKALAGDPASGERIFHAAGCASCHHAPDAKGEERLVLSGGQVFETSFGSFVAPNVSPDREAGLGNWSLEDFASALRFGTSPSGEHYYPAFPYTSYTRMSDDQIADLWSFLKTLPADNTPSRAHDVGFPFSFRPGVGVWKLIYLDRDWITREPGDDVRRQGRILVEALGHCGECHTPRDAFGGLKLDNWLAGAPNPTGTGTVPALTPDQFNWSESDIAYYLETGFTPDFDSAGGHMVSVIENFSSLPTDDRQAVAAYIKALGR